MSTPRLDKNFIQSNREKKKHKKQTKLEHKKI